MTRWVHQVTFVVNKDFESGLLESKVKELVPGARIVSISKQELAEQSEGQ